MRFISVVILAVAVTGCGHHPQVIRGDRQPDRPARLVAGTTAVDSQEAVEAFDDGVALLRTGNYERAQEAFESALEADYSNWKSHYYLGLTLHHRQQPDAAMAALHHGLRLAPDDPRARSRVYVAMGKVSESSGEVGRARVSYMTALQIWPESDSARDGLARLDRLTTASRR